MKYFIKTFGCQMNEADSERIAGWYEQKGWQKAESMEQADEIVINSCSVRESAENRVFGLVNNLQKLKIINCKLKIVLTGCMLRYPLRLLKEKLPHVDAFVKINQFRKVTEFQDEKVSKFRVRESKTHAWVLIMEGCNNFCSYCVVPYARGREKSRSFAEIVCEASKLARRGYKEITLLGQNVNSYGKDLKPKKGFSRLLTELHKISGIKKISFMTSNPWDLTDDIIEAISLPKIDRYLHLPVQSGDDEVLEKMNRKYTAKDYLALVKKIRKQIPDIQIGTDIIVGFPGETEEQFNNTVLLCRKIGFTKAYVARYSPRPGTAAFKLKDNVPPSEKKRRWRILDEMINKKNVLI